MTRSTWVRDLARAALAACLLGALAPSATAQGQDARRRASALLAAGEYEQALAVVEEGLAADPEDAALLTVRAKAYMDLRDFEQALVAYEKVVAVTKGANRRAAQRIVASLDDVRTSFLELTVSSGSASVYLDSKSLGVWCVAEPTCKRGMVPGYYRLIVEAEGHEPLRKNVTIKVGETTRLAEALTARPSPLTVAVAQPGALIELDGEPLGPAPQTTTVAAGEHRLRVTLDGHVPHEEVLTIAGGKPVELRVELGSWVAVAVTPADAELFVGAERARLDDGKLALPPGGPYTVTARAPGHAERSVEIPAGRAADHAVELVLSRSAWPLTVRGPSGATVMIDGKAHGALPLAAPIEVSAGEHVVEIAAPGAAPYRSTLRFDAAAQLDIGIDRRERRLGQPVRVAATVSAAGLMGALTLGYLAFDAAKRHDERAGEAGVRIDDPELADLKSRSDRFALLSDVSLGVALVSAGVGTYFLVKDLKAGDHAEVRATITPTGASLSGRF
jgi:hypothetical protein